MARLPIFFLFNSSQTTDGHLISPDYATAQRGTSAMPIGYSDTDSVLIGLGLDPVANLPGSEPLDVPLFGLLTSMWT